MAVKKKVHIIGAGLAGLACAVALTKKKFDVSIYEAAPQAGGRCRSFMDDTLGQVIDNGNHLLLSANKNAARYAEWILPPDVNPYDIPFTGLVSSKSMYSPIILRDMNVQRDYHLYSNKPVNGFTFAQHVTMLQMILFPGRKCVAEFFDRNDPFYKTILVPLCISALNTEPEQASAKLFAKVLFDWVLKTDRISPYYKPALTLQDTYVDNAIAYIERHGGSVHYNRRLKSFDAKANNISILRFADSIAEVGKCDSVVLAVPPWALEKIEPGLKIDFTYNPIVNGHFKTELFMDMPEDMKQIARNHDFIGFANSPLHWIFFKNGLLSTTTSAAGEMAEMDHVEIAKLLWSEVKKIIPNAGELPVHRIIVEKRATFASTPENERKRPKTVTIFPNCFLAGDYIHTGLPATIESAVTSGFAAARAAKRYCGCDH